MARPTPAVLRAASILNLLAAHPGRAYSLTDILKALRINKATLHSALAALEEVGYLARASDKTYTLGPALIRIARTVADRVSPLQVAGPEMRSFANEFDVVCSAVFRDRDKVVVRERAASISHLEWTLAPDTSFQLRPPFGGIFLAWGPQPDADRWLGMIENASERARAAASLDYIRACGYGCGIRPQSLESPEPPHFDDGAERLSRTDFLIDRLEPNAKYVMTSLSAPVFDEHSNVSFCLVTFGFPQALTPTAIDHIGKRLRTACDLITHATGGELPADDVKAVPPAARQSRPRKAATARATP